MAFKILGFIINVVPFRYKAIYLWLSATSTLENYLSKDKGPRLIVDP